jgi:hypothetical protein
MDSWPSSFITVDADVGGGEFGGVGVAESMHERAGHGLGIGAGAFERPFDPRLQGSLGDALPVAPTKSGERSRPRWAEATSTSGCPAWAPRSTFLYSPKAHCFTPATLTW